VVRNDASGIVHPVRAGVAAFGGEGLFRRATALSARVEGHLAPEVEKEGEYVRVPVQSLDEMVLSTQPRAVKVDDEGGEIDVLRGGSRTIRRGSACWVVEVHHQHAKVSVQAIFGAEGYRVQLLRPRHPVYRDYRQEYVVAEPGQ
jgi:hypothetical protein